jgi:hypothetical protein
MLQDRRPLSDSRARATVKSLDQLPACRVGWLDEHLGEMIGIDPVRRRLARIRRPAAWASAMGECVAEIVGIARYGGVSV